ncbi:hypothetical protein ACFV3R_34470 [Streptomyces sp. NPDC059740]
MNKSNTSKPGFTTAARPILHISDTSSATTEVDRSYIRLEHLDFEL